MDASIITSVHNPHIKQAKALHERRERKKRGLLIIEGSRFIAEAFAAGAQISVCYYVEEHTMPSDSSLLQELAVAGAQIVPVSAQVMAAMADTATPQGMMAVAALPRFFDHHMLDKGNLVLVADQVRDPGNLGAMLRTAAAVGVGMILLAGCTDPTSPKVIRGSAGACYAVPMWVGPTVEETLQHLQTAGYRAVVLDMDGAQSLFATDLRGRVALVVGNEGHGPNPAWTKAGAELVHIPMPGRIESLNAGVAAAVVLYEAWRQSHVGC